MSDIRKVFNKIASRAPRKETIEVNGEKLDVYFRHMKLPDYAGVRGLSSLKPEERIDKMPQVIARFLCDEKGGQVYDPDKPEDVAEIAGFDLEMISAIASALNGIDPEKEKTTDQVGEADASPK